MRNKDLEVLLDKKVRTRVLASMLTCKICNKLIKESTAIADCLHSFCQKCIYKKVFEEKSRKCPVCNVEFSDPPAKVLRPDATMRSLKVSLLGVHKRTPEQRAESKRIKFENMQSSNDQAKKPQSTKKPMITWTDKTKEKVIDKPLEDEHISSQTTKNPPITYKDKGNAIVTDESSEGHRILSQTTKKPPITYKDKGKAIVTDESSEGHRILSQTTKKPPITYKDKGKAIVTDESSEGHRILSQSTKKPPITYKDKGKAIVTDESSERHRILKDKGKKKIIYAPLVKLPGDELDDESEDEVDDESEDESYDPWDSLQAIYGSKKGIVIRSSPPRSPPPPLPVHENKMISSKSIGKRPMQEIIPMDSEKMAVTAATVSGSKSEEPKRRVRHKRVATPSNGTMIYPQDVIDAGKNINPAKKTHYAWFILAPSEEQNRKEPLRPLPVPNVRIKFDWNSHPTVSTLLKYIAMQLRLDSREEVCIFMYGSLLSPEMKLVDVENQWMKIVGPERKTTNIGTSAQYYCIKLTYA